MSVQEQEHVQRTRSHNCPGSVLTVAYALRIHWLPGTLCYLYSSLTLVWSVFRNTPESDSTKSRVVSRQDQPFWRQPDLCIHPFHRILLRPSAKAISSSGSLPGACLQLAGLLKHHLAAVPVSLPGVLVMYVPAYVPPPDSPPCAPDRSSPIPRCLDPSPGRLPKGRILPTTS